MSHCPQWNLIERASDLEAPREHRARAAAHVRACPPCRSALRSHLRLRRMLRSMPLPALAPSMTASLQSALAQQQRLSLQTWLRRTTAVAAAVLAACTLTATLANGNDAGAAVDIESYLLATSGDRSADTPQTVARWIVQDLRGQ